jgi:hypothetical protein
MKDNLLCLDLTILDVDLVPAKYDRNVVADTNKITVPVRNISVSDSRSNVEHDDCTLSLDAKYININSDNQNNGKGVLVSIPQTTELFLASSVPAIEFNLSTVGVECQRMNFNSKGCYTKIMDCVGN